VEILKPEVDCSGYDVVLVKGDLVRHVQLKASIKGGRAAAQNINASLALQGSGCVIWIVVDTELKFDSYLWLGGLPGRRLPSLAGYPAAKHARGNADGIKADRVNTKKIPKRAFTQVASLPALAVRLFGK
jgi:hypothetical protein